MYKILFSITMIMFFSSMVKGEREADLIAIKSTAFEYMDSWYKGDKKRMEDSLHPALAKRSLTEGSDGKKDLKHTTAADMVLNTNSGYGKSLWRSNYEIEVEVLDFFKDIASVKVTAPHYLEYLHLTKINNKWVILNALYQVKRPSSN